MGGKTIGLVATVVLLSAGCVTPSQTQQMNNTANATYRIVRDLQKDIGGSVTQLNETTAKLIARVDETDVQTRKLQSVVEENQVKLDAIKKRLDELANVLYRQFNLTPPTTGTGPRVDVKVEPTPAAPTGAAAEPVSQRQASEPSVAEESVPAPQEQAAGTAVTAYQRAQEAFGTEDYQRALTLFDEYLRRYPSTDYTNKAQFYKAECLLKLNQYGPAVAEFEKLRANYPKSTMAPVSMYNQAYAHLMLKENGRAIELLKEIVDEYPMTAVAERAKKKLQELEQN